MQIFVSHQIKLGPDCSRCLLISLILTQAGEAGVSSVWEGAEARGSAPLSSRDSTVLTWRLTPGGDLTLVVASTRPPRVHKHQAPVIRVRDPSPRPQSVADLPQPSEHVLGVRNGLQRISDNFV